ncbi:ribonuclease H family protein [uncultured Clostridium sp.]|jgi:ribonuclease HI|uniref:ribonuclease H family protein n=1 Tax=uncultured Clostridium sp. TaxID=59620 RepID=UPI002632AA16|nr:ribonuclease H family protein [uncultured Clostridium sp.]
MAKKKYYAVAKGKSGVAMILESWPACQKEVIGAKGAIYKSFENIDEAKEFIRLQAGGTASGEEIIGDSDSEVFDGLRIYVDGSFMLHKGNFSFGLVAIKDGEILHTDKGVGEDEDAIALRNVSGEVMGAMKAVEYALKNKYEEVTICFDYQGIECWALGTWKRNKILTQKYNEFMAQNMKKIKVNFMKIKGHSGNKFNDMADRLAKAALEEY